MEVHAFEKLPAKISKSCSTFNPKPTLEKDFRAIFGTYTVACITKRKMGML